MGGSRALAQGWPLVAGGPPPTLGPLSILPATASIGQPYSGTISGATPGSTITLDSLTVSGTGTTRTVTGTPTGVPGNWSALEVLATAPNSPKTTPNLLTVTAAVPITIGPTAAAFISTIGAGSLVSRVYGVPTGQTPTFTPTAPADNGKVVVAGSEAAGWTLVAGMVPAAPGTIPGTLAAGSQSTAVSLLVEAPPQVFTTPYQHYFASNRTRSPTSQGSPNVAGNVYTIHEIFLGKTPYALSEFAAAFASHYTKADPSDNELAAPATFTLQGVSIGFGATRAGATWVQIPFTAAADAAITPVNSLLIDPTVNSIGALASKILDTAIPAGSYMWLKTQVYAPGAMIFGYEINTPAGEGAIGSATDSLGVRLLDGSTSQGQTSGRIGSQMYGPSFVTGKGTDGRPVALVLGDSIAYGKNETGANFGSIGSPTLGDGGSGGGAYSRGLNDEITTQKWQGGNYTIPGSGFSDIANNGRVKTARKWDLVKLATVQLNGNVSRPLASVIISEHGTNSLAGTLSTFVPTMKAYHALVRAEWPGLPLAHATMLPKATTTDGYQTLANQTAGSQDATTGLRFQFNDKLLADALDGTVDYPLNSFQYYSDPTQRDKWKVIPRTATLAQAIAAGSTGSGNPVIVNENTMKVGDFIGIAPDQAGTSSALGSGSNITAITGTGPYTLTLNTGITAPTGGWPVGTIVKPHYATDSAGLHPGTIGNIEAIPLVTNFKQVIQAKGSGKPRLDPSYRPVLVNPVTVTIPVGSNFSNQGTPYDENTDIIIQLSDPTAIMTKQINFYGGRNIIFENIHMREQVYLADFTGTAYVASCCIDVFLAPASRLADCMRFKGKRRSDGTLTADATVDNCNFGGTRGNSADGHTDCIQFLNGSVIRKFTHRYSTCDSNYQLYILQNQPGNTSSSETQIIEIDHVNGFYNNNPGETNSTAFFMGSGKHPGVLNEFYINWRAGSSVLTTIVPNANTAGQSAYAAIPDQTGSAWTFATFPDAMELAGRVKKGVPPAGDFCPKASVAKG